MGGRRTRGILGAAIGIVAAVAIPFAAPAVAGALFGSTALGAVTAAGGLLGAGSGALAGSLTGNAGRGALLGAAGGAAGSFIRAGGIGATQNALFGAPEAAGATVAPGGITTEALAAPAGVTEVAGTGAYAPNLPTEIAAAAPTGAPAGTFGEGFNAAFRGQPASGIGSAAGGAGAAAPAPSFFSAEGLGRAAGTAAAGLTSPTGLASVAQLGMTLYNKPPQDLTPQERAFVAETAELAQTNRAAFDQRVAAARRLLQQGQANPEQAFAQAGLGVERSMREAGFGSEADRRRSLIEKARLGTLGVAAENTRAATATQAGLAAMPTTAPAGAATLALPAYQDVERRRREYEADLARSGGRLAGTLFGTGSSKSSSNLFG